MPIRQALRYWELRRGPYNLALAALAGAIVLRTWPHFRPVIAPGSIAPLAVLVLLANLCYCAVYPVEFALGRSDRAWRHWRAALWVVGTLLALFIESYWILDEIYPAIAAFR
jgi:hypothetical protein